MEKIRVIMFILLTLIFVGSCSQSNSIRVGSQKELKAKIETMREGDSINVSKLSKVSKDIFDINEVQTRIRESRRYDYSFALFINVKPLQSVHIYLEDVTHSITSLNSRNFIL
ncbi:MAG: hypothetical protein LBT79_00945, partial [Elusimicrobiota bacterium]|nr:hypothetical protein [Elusimicrobiota bacterium]